MPNLLLLLLNYRILYGIFQEESMLCPGSAEMAICSAFSVWAVSHLLLSFADSYKAGRPHSGDRLCVNFDLFKRTLATNSHNHGFTETRFPSVVLRFRRADASCAGVAFGLLCTFSAALKADLKRVHDALV